jgi:hypothetical protein
MMPFWCACWSAVADLEEEPDPLADPEVLAIAVLRDRRALDVLHHEVRPAGVVVPAE